MESQEEDSAIRIAFSIQETINAWREKEDELLAAQARELQRLHEGRFLAENLLSFQILEAVGKMCEARTNRGFEILRDLAQGYSLTDENLWEHINERAKYPLVRIEPFYEVAERLGQTTAGQFLSDVLRDFHKRLREDRDVPDGYVTLPYVSAQANDGDRGSGLVAICGDHHDHFGKYISIGFDTFVEENGKKQEIRVRGWDFLSENVTPGDLEMQHKSGSFNERFAQMILSEQVSVAAALFVASDLAVGQKLRQESPPALLAQ